MREDLKQFKYRADESVLEMLREMAAANTRSMNQQVTALVRAEYARFKKDQQNDAAA